MTKRERQYTNWKTFWRRRKPVEVTYNEQLGMYTSTVLPGRIRIPDTMLVKMGLR